MSAISELLTLLETEGPTDPAWKTATRKAKAEHDALLTNLAAWKAAWAKQCDATGEQAWVIPGPGNKVSYLDLTPTQRDMLQDLLGHCMLQNLLEHVESVNDAG